MIPLVQHPRELRQAKELMVECGIDLEKVDVGIMVEIPASALIIDEFIKEGLDFVSFGTNDLTQYTLAVDRNNELVADLYNELHPAVLKLIEYVIGECNKAGVKTSICGQAGAARRSPDGSSPWASPAYRPTSMRSNLSGRWWPGPRTCLDPRGGHEKAGSENGMKEDEAPEDEVFADLAEAKDVPRYDRFSAPCAPAPPGRREGSRACSSRQPRRSQAVPGHGGDRARGGDAGRHVAPAGCRGLRHHRRHREQHPGPAGGQEGGLPGEDQHRGARLGPLLVRKIADFSAGGARPRWTTASGLTHDGSRLCWTKARSRSWPWRERPSSARWTRWKRSPHRRRARRFPSRGRGLRRLCHTLFERAAR